MKTITRAAKASAVLGAVLFASSAHAADSTRPPWYVQLTPASVGYLNTCNNAQTFYQGNIPSGLVTACGSGLAYRVDVEAGYHFTHRHDGFVLGIRQAFYFAGSFKTVIPAPYDQVALDPRGGSGGVSQVRFGYDIAVPIKDFELTVAPFIVAGAAYSFEAHTNAAFAFGLGLDVRFFLTKAFYLFVRPGEIGAFLPGGVAYEGGLGAGLAF